MVHKLFIVAVDFQTYPSSIPSALLPQLKTILITITPNNVDAAKQFLQKHSKSPELTIHAEVSQLDASALPAIQEAGASYLIVTLDQLHPLIYSTNMPMDGRVAVILDSNMRDQEDQSLKYHQAQLAQLLDGRSGGEIVVGTYAIEVTAEEVADRGGYGNSPVDWHKTPCWIRMPKWARLPFVENALTVGNVVLEVERLQSGDSAGQDGNQGGDLTVEKLIAIAKERQEAIDADK